MSILTPSFNQVRWLPDNLGSVRAQTYPAIEHVVMDGASTDGSVEALREAGDTIVWHSEPDTGQSNALNKAFAASSGDIIGWINSDDGYFSNTAVEDAVKYLEHHPDIDVVYGHAAYINADGLVLHFMWVPAFLRWWFMRSDYISQPTVFLRRSALEDHFVDESFDFAMDYELWLRLLSQGRRFARIDKVLAFDRVQPDRKTLTNTDVRAENVARLERNYGIRTGGMMNSVFMSVLGVFSRLAGMRLVGAARGKLAYDAPLSTRGELLRRQIAQRRSTMEIGQ